MLARRLQAAVLLLLGSQGVHHLRYLVAPQEHNDHGYGSAHLLVTGPAIGALLALVLAALIVRAAGRPTAMPGRRVRLVRLWPAIAAAVLSIYGAQELVEGVLGHGHDGGLAALTADGGWVAAPIAAAFGGLIALVVRVARAADQLVCGPAVALVAVRLLAPAAMVAGERIETPPRLGFALIGASRGPPVVS